MKCHIAYLSVQNFKVVVHQTDSRALSVSTLTRVFTKQIHSINNCPFYGFPMYFLDKIYKMWILTNLLSNLITITEQSNFHQNHSLKKSLSNNVSKHSLF